VPWLQGEQDTGDYRQGWKDREPKSVTIAI
jgi:hypothetical protein